MGRVNGYRLGIAGHCVTNPEEAVHHTILWEPTHGKSRRGASRMNYVTLLKENTGLDNTHETEISRACCVAPELGVEWPVAPELRLGE